MANWAKLQEQLTGLPVVKRAKHSIHFDKGNGEIVANFSGKPCHYEDKGVWKPIDTTLLLGADGFYGCQHSPVKVHKDGRVKVDKSDYSQFTKLPGNPVGKVDGNRIVREFPGGRQYLYVTEDGFREEIVVDKPTFPLEKFIGKTSGTLPSAYKASPQTAVDANGDVFEITSDTKAFGDWLDGAAYPVTIDPDFSIASGSTRLLSAGDVYSAVRAPTGTVYLYDGIVFGQQWSTRFDINRYPMKFDTSSIGAGSTVTQVNFKMKSPVGTWRDESDTDFDVVIKKCDWSSNDPMDTIAKRRTVFNAILSADNDDSIWRSTSGWTYSTVYTSGNLSTAWVNKTGATYYALISSRDVAGNEPTGNEYVSGCTLPVLTVTYTAGSTGVPKHFLHYARLRSN